VQAESVCEGNAGHFIVRLHFLATEAYGEIYRLQRIKDVSARKGVELTKFLELLELLEHEVHFGDPLSFSELVATKEPKFWWGLARKLAPKFPTLFFPEIAAAAFTPVFTHMCECRSDPCKCKKEDIGLILQFIEWVMGGASVQTCYL